MWRHIFIFSSLPVMLLVAFASFGYFTFTGSNVIKQPDALVRVESGDKLYSKLRIWNEQKIIKNNSWFKLMVKFNPELGQIKAGSYKLPAAATPAELLTLLSSGKEHQFNFTIIEGETIWQLKDKIQQNSYIKQTDWHALDLQYGHLEGMFFPDTYAFTDQTTDVDILQRAHNKLVEVLNEQWQRRQSGLPYKTPYEALITASIIEKETGVANERPIIASVFVNRLRKRMKLQMDPTVIYGLGEHFDGDIKKSDLRSPTPYNTYVINGLPPTPISMVSEAAIHAALNPQQTSYLYFVAVGDGSHHFSTNLKEHNQALQRYLKVLSER